MSAQPETHKYIPQRPPFVMIDAFKSLIENGIQSEFTISPENVLVVDGVFQESGLVENMAQTAAMYAGYTANKSNLPAPIGFIGALRNLKIIGLPRVAEKLTTSVKLKSEVMNIQIVEAEVRNEAQEILAECELRIFLKPE